MIRFFLTAFAFAFTMASPSFAADMPGRFREPVDVAPLVNWAGLYAGINAGYGWGHSNWSSSVTAGTTDPAGGLVGATLGFNVQSGQFVFGLEGDASGSWIRDHNSTGTGICAANGCEIQNSWFGTARARVGYAYDRALLYLTLGGAFGDVQMSTNSMTATADRAGWTGGVGLEYAFLGPWSAKVEYLYTDLGSARCGTGICGVDTTVNYKLNIVRLGVNYRFW